MEINGHWLIKTTGWMSWCPRCEMHLTNEYFSEIDCEQTKKYGENGEWTPFSLDHMMKEYPDADFSSLSNIPLFAFIVTALF